jgi:N-acetylneuraminate synthase/N,N'-diacetyllegionaminate synthase
MDVIEIAGRKIGAGHPCFIIAEAGVNHNGDPELAHRLIDVAAEAGADAVKFQTFEPEKLASPEAAMSAYQSEGESAGDTQLEMLRALALPREAYRELMQHAAERGLIFISTAFEESSGDFLEELGVPAFKLSSDDVINLPLLVHLSHKGLPMILSTGMADLAEVVAGVETIRAHGNAPLALLHCISRYPAEADECNLRAMETLRRACATPVGWSDHTLGIDISLAAVALGADLLEKHYTLDRSLPGPDHQASLEPEEFGQMVACIRRVQSALGDGVKAPREAELVEAVLGRKSLHWRASLPGGTVVGREHVIALRPATGISPASLDAVLGRQLARPVEAGTVVAPEDLAGEFAVGLKRAVGR